jgi:diadenosine tetraphosphate (Ap4A) HIT family hydrolase
MKRDRDDTDFQAARTAYEHRESTCPFCSTEGRQVLLNNSLAYVMEDKYPVTDGHLLVIPKRHMPEVFELGTAEIRACHQLISEARPMTLQWDATVRGFNIGFNCGVAAGQTVMHCHVHVIPRRQGDAGNPRGGIRGVIPGKADYVETR